MVIVRDHRGDEVPASDGVFHVRDQASYFVEFPNALPAELPRFVRRVHHSSGRFAEVKFDNYVGKAEGLGLRFDVFHSKLTASGFEEMLARVVEDASDLIFSFDAATAVSFDERRLEARSAVPFHLLAWLREVLTRGGPHGRLGAAFLQLARNPHRKMEREAAFQPAWDAQRLAAGAWVQMISGEAGQVRLPHSHPFARTQMARRLGRGGEPAFPLQVLAERRSETFDTHENRLVKAVLGKARAVIAAFDEGRLRNPELRQDVARMREALDWFLSFDFLQSVQKLSYVPVQSSVLQRSSGYRAFFAAYLRLSSALAHAAPSRVFERLIDLKDCALLYELWCFFETKRIVSGLLGPPSCVTSSAATDSSRELEWGAEAVFQGGRVRVIYNRSYSRGQGTWSVRLRPDVVVQVEEPSGGRRSLVLDAKLKFDGKAFSSSDDGEDEARRAARADLHKMHAYRDAVHDTVGAFVLYPGSVPEMFRESPGHAVWEGVGAIPAVPGGDGGFLRDLLAQFIDA